MRKLMAEKSVHTGLFGKYNRPQVSQNHPSNREHHSGDMPEATEIGEEDEAPGTDKKRLQGSHISIPSFEGQGAGNILLHSNAPLPFCEHFSYASSSKFLLHCVIRI